MTTTSHADHTKSNLACGEFDCVLVVLWKHVVAPVDDGAFAQFLAGRVLCDFLVSLFVSRIRLGENT